jgi:hypothetical protein
VTDCIGADVIQCIKCLANKTIDDFAPSKINKSGHRYECRDCQRAYMAQWRKKRMAQIVNVVPVKECSKCGFTKASNEFYKSSVLKSGLTSACKQCLLSVSKLYRTKNAEKIHAKVRQWHKENPEAVKRIKRNWNYRNKDSVRQNVLRRRALLKANGVFEVRKKFLRRLYDSSCVVCNSIVDIQADHIVPLSRGGTHSEGNLQPLCQKCNYTKHHRTMMEWKLNKVVSV